MGLNGEALRPAVEYIKQNGLTPVYEGIENPKNFQSLRNTGKLELPGLTIDVHTFGLALFASLKIPHLMAKEWWRLSKHSGSDKNLLKFVHSAVDGGAIDAALKTRHINQTEEGLQSDLNALGWIVLTCLHSTDVETMLRLHSKQNTSLKLHKALFRVWEESQPKTRSRIDLAHVNFDKKQTIYYQAASQRIPHAEAAHDILYGMSVKKAVNKYNLSDDETRRLVNSLIKSKIKLIFEARRPTKWFKKPLRRVAHAINRADYPKVVQSRLDQLTIKEAETLAREPWNVLVTLSRALRGTRFEKNLRIVLQLRKEKGKRVSLTEKNGTHYIRAKDISKLQAILQAS